MLDVRCWTLNLFTVPAKRCLIRAPPLARKAANLITKKLCHFGVVSYEIFNIDINFYHKLFCQNQRFDPFFGFRDGFEIMYHAHEHITQNFCYSYLTVLIQCFHHHWAKLITFRFVFIDAAHMIYDLYGFSAKVLGAVLTNR